MNRFKKTMMGLGMGAALAFGSVNAAHAIDVPWDPDGTGPLQHLGINGNAPLGLLSGLDWAEGNAIAVDSVPIQVGATFTVHYQAKLSKFSLPNGVNETNFNADGTTGSAQTISGLAPDFEWTVNARFTERVIGVSGSTVFFALVNDPTNYLKIFYDAAANSNNGLGTGFIDGQEILSASLAINDNSSFTVNGSGQLSDLGGASVHGSGSFNIEAIIDSWDEDFLGLSSIGVLPGQVRTTLITSTLELPFGPAQPAAQFEQVGGPPVIPNFGPVNGVTGPDFVFEADGNQVFTLAEAVPEPATAALALSGLLGLTLRRRRLA